MTRETKIGLLVGLAFIIVIGILLSDHLTSSTEPPQAALGVVGNNVRQTTVTPGATAPPITAVVTPQVQPQQPVMTQQEANRPQPVQIINVGPTRTQQPQSQNVVSVQAPTQQQPPVQVQQPEQQPPVQVAHERQTNEIPITRTPEVKGTLSEVAQQVGEPLVGLHGETVTQSNDPKTNTKSNDSKPVIVATAAGKQYKAEEGDSVSSMARKFMGGNTKANRDAIVAANPSLQQNPDRIIAGRTYLIPNEVTASAQSAQPQQQQPAPVAVNDKKEQPATNDGNDNVYVVKSGDSLSKIAVMQCGNGAAVTAIKDLNKDILKDSDTIQVGMKLRLPSKPLASAAN
jgi:nucleoid-associated protein YgaU